jgi:hypothetical protein
MPFLDNADSVDRLRTNKQRGRMKKEEDRIDHAISAISRLWPWYYSLATSAYRLNRSRSKKKNNENMMLLNIGQTNKEKEYWQFGCKGQR